MDLKKILSTYLKRFDSSIIFERGQKYCENGMVYDLDYSSEQNQILAQIHGSQRNVYTVKIRLNGEKVDAYCTCLYDSSPCKHVIAAILAFLSNQQKYVDRGKAEQQKLKQIKAKLDILSKGDLVEFILKIAEKRPDFKRDLFIKFSDDRDEIIKTIAKNVDSLCKKFEAGNENSKEFAMKLRTLSESLGNNNSTVRLHTAWIVADRIIGILNEYGIGDDEVLEDIVFEHLETITELLGQNKSDTSLRTMILKGLLGHYLKHNCGVMDYVSESIFKICTEKSDYEILIMETERAHGDLKENDSYYKDLIEDLLKELKEMRDKATV